MGSHLERDSDQDVIRRFALAGLRDLGDSKSWDTAAMWSEYGNPTQTRIVAIDAFSRLGLREDKTADLLIHLLDDPNVFIRQRAIRSLGEGGFEKARAALNRMARTEVHSETKRTIQRALQRLGSTTRVENIQQLRPSWKLVDALPPAKQASSGQAASLVP